MDTMSHAAPSHRSRLRAIARRAMIDHGLLPDFSQSAQQQTADAMNTALDVSPGIRDFRDRLWASIDNDDSRDLDQLSVAESLPDGRVKIFIAVADVDASIADGSAVDTHARVNTTSVYTAADMFPMLPERFSTDLTSLGEGEDRLALVVDMTVDADGTVVDSTVSRAVVRNQAKLAYNGVAAWLEGTGPTPARVAAVKGLDEQLRLQDRVAQSMKGLRHRHGALTLETLETRPVFEGDFIADLRASEKNRAKELIEDFMVAANGATARYLEAQGFSSLRRVLRAPERWTRIMGLAETYGVRLPDAPSAPELEAFLNARRSADPARFPDLSLSVVKLLGSGEYAVERPGQQHDGHFGLAVGDYTHSTAPNRRYPDLITQRLLKAALAGRPSPYAEDELAQLARHCTMQEDNAAKVERQVRKSAAALLLAARLGERFDGIVTGASEKGTWVRTLQPPVEGRVVQGFAGLDVGDRVRVELIGTDVDRGYIDFAVATRGRSGRPSPNGPSQRGRA